MPSNNQHISFKVSIALALFGSICLALMSFFSLSPSVSVNAGTASSVDNIQLDVGVGSGGFTRQGYWLPVFATLTNKGSAAFSGSITAETYTGSTHNVHLTAMSSVQSFDETVSVPANKKQRFSLYMPFNTGPAAPRGIMVYLHDNHGRLLASKTQDVNTIEMDEISVGVLSDQSSIISNTLGSLLLPAQANSLHPVPLDASSFPSQTTSLENFDMIILDDFSTASLSRVQLSVLETWINRGGVLIEAGGPEWQRTLSSLPAGLLPVDVQGTSEIPSGSHLLPTGGFIVQAKQPADTTPVPITISNAAVLPQAGSAGSPFGSMTVLEDNLYPMLVQTHVGQGIICYLAFDPATPPLTKWTGVNNLWIHLLTRTLGDQLLMPAQAPRYDSGPGSLLTRAGLITALQPSLSIPPWIVIALLLCYIAILGPIRILIVKTLKKPFWSWRIILSGILIFSGFAYGLAFYQKGASLFDNSISVIQLNQGGSASHITTYMGVFVPSQDNFKVRFPDLSQAQTVSDPLSASGVSVLNDDSFTPVSYGPNETDIGLLNTGLWTFHPIVAEQDRQFQGGLTSQLTLHGQKLIGTIKNTLATSLSGVYVLLPHSFIYVGNLPAGGTFQVNQQMQSLSSSSGATLADQLAQRNNLRSPYFPYANNGQPQNLTQRHLAELTALSGAGFSFSSCTASCYSSAIVNTSKNTIITPSPWSTVVPMATGYDPLLVNGTQATLVGWADHPLDGTDNTTINGSLPHGFHDNLIQMPVTLSLATPFELPSDFISGQVVDAQGSSVEMILPGIYTMPSGSLSFEFTLPSIPSGTPISTLSISIPNALNNAGAATSGTGYLQTNLYNWQKNTWDAFSFSQNTLWTLDTASYIGPDGRVLLQVSNQSTSHRAIYLSRPALYLN